MKAIIKIVSIITSAVIMISTLLVDISAADTDTVKTGSFSYAPALIEGTATDSYFYSDSYDIKFKERPLYHVATFVLNLSEFTVEHTQQYNWELVKSLDSYYSENVQYQTGGVSDGDNANPATGTETAAGIVLLSAVGMIAVSKKKT